MSAARGASRRAATTGRPRRCGWLDLVQLKEAIRLTGVTGIVITKLDTLAGFGPLQVCVAYERDGKRVDCTPADEEGWATLKPVYEALPGIPTTPVFMGAQSDAALPREARDYVAFIEKRLGVQVSVVSTGPQREAMIRRGDVLGF